MLIFTNALMGRDTHTHTHTHCKQKYQETRGTPPLCASDLISIDSSCSGIPDFHSPRRDCTGKIRRIQMYQKLYVRMHRNRQFPMLIPMTHSNCHRNFAYSYVYPCIELSYYYFLCYFQFWIRLCAGYCSNHLLRVVKC